LSFSLTAVAAVLFAVFLGLVATGQKGGDTFFSNPWLSGTITAGAVCAVGAAVTGLYAIIRERERSILVFATTTIGLLVLIYVILEISLPH
jgi:hypothetical protein